MTGRKAGRSYWLVRTGIGPVAAEAAVKAVFARQPMALAISAGFAGALMPAAIGDVIVGSSVSADPGEGDWSACDRVAGATVRATAEAIGLEVRVGPVISLSTVVCHAAEKQDIGRRTGAIAVDMESAALGSVARAYQIPFLIVRTVSDMVDEDLPLDFNVFLRPSGWVRGMVAFMRQPARSLMGLNRLRRQIGLASERLTALCSACVKTGFAGSTIGENER